MSEEGPPLSSNLQKWRMRRQLSVSALARAAEISKSTVSELERGLGNPSLDTLWAIAKTLNVPLGALFTDSGTNGDLEVRRYADAPAMESDDVGHVAKILSGWRADGEIEIAVVTLADGARRDSRGNAPGVVERVVCVQGTVAVGTEESSAELGVGDLIRFRADQPHFYAAIAGPGRLVVVQEYGDVT
ncbi:helix-turn-helix domain-containing protein [Pseudactinotalea sp. Z1739]|uniref:helix-turn-helix domain-containing protein n=1 Tax=Pseudactinotalea sp. Z1739 TaxID=3413028 RepID=UPI003C7AF2E6